jgi:hypothetical protein
MQEWADRDSRGFLCKSRPTSVEMTRKKEEFTLFLIYLYLVYNNSQFSHNMGHTWCSNP